MDLEFLLQGMSQEELQDEQNPGTNISGLARSLNSDFDLDHHNLASNNKSKGERRYSVNMHELLR